MDCDIFISVHNVTKYAIKVGYHANNCDWCDYVLSWRDWYNRISTHAVTSLIRCGTSKFATFQGFVIKWIHNPARNPVSGYKIKWESTKYRSKMAVGTYELSIENWTYGSDETYPKRVLQNFKKVRFFLKIAYFAPLNALHGHTAWSKKTTLLRRFLGHGLLTTLHLSGHPWVPVFLKIDSPARLCIGHVIVSCHVHVFERVWTDQQIIQNYQEVNITRHDCALCKGTS